MSSADIALTAFLAAAVLASVGVILALVIQEWMLRRQYNKAEKALRELFSLREFLEEESRWVLSEHGWERIEGDEE